MLWQNILLARYCFWKLISGKEIKKVEVMTLRSKIRVPLHIFMLNSEQCRNMKRLYSSFNYELDKLQCCYNNESWKFMNFNISEKFTQCQVMPTWNSNDYFFVYIDFFWDQNLPRFFPSKMCVKNNR